MRRTSSLALVAIGVLIVSLGLPSLADAGRKKKRAKSHSADEKALAQLMGPYKWGMTKKQILGILSKQINERYAEKISATSDVYRQDRLRRAQKKEIGRIKGSYVEFTGKKGGWDVSLVDDQFTHKTDESMLVYWENHEGRNQRRFFFFHDDRLYKMFIALDTESLQDEQRNFGFFKQLMEARFGEGTATDTGLVWQGKKYKLEAVDKLAFYNSFCLVISSPPMVAALDTIRADRAPKGDKGGSRIIEAVTADEDDEGPSLDQGANTIDSILGKQ